MFDNSQVVLDGLMCLSFCLGWLSAAFVALSLTIGAFVWAATPRLNFAPGAARVWFKRAGVALMLFVWFGTLFGGFQSARQNSSREEWAQRDKISRLEREVTNLKRLVPPEGSTSRPAAYSLPDR